jgi:Trypsin
MVRGTALLLAATAVTAALALGAAPAARASGPASPGNAAGNAVGSAAGDSAGNAAVTVTFSAAAQKAAVRYWTPERLAAATTSPAAAVPPRGTAKAMTFTGVPTVGALFLSTAATVNICTASVVDSRGLDVLLTAAHCVDYGGGHNYGQNLVFIPSWHRGQRPYGVWPVRSITVDRAWVGHANVNDDFAFLTVGLSASKASKHEPIQRITGGLKLGVNTGYRHSAVVPIGYDMSGGGLPVRCRTKSFYARPDQQEFLCDGYTDGASGGPWITGFNARTGTGTVIGDIGGYQQGGNLAWTGFSPYFGSATEQLYRQVP